MSDLIKKLTKKGLISPPSFLSDTTQYLCIMGSSAYGVSNSNSDIDIYGYCIPPKGVLFPHTEGYIEGFDRNIPKFEQFQQHHVKEGEKEYDFSIYGIIKYIRLVADNNPNMIDSLFVPRRCIIHSTKIHEHVRNNRKKFLHKGVFHKFRGYSFAQLHKMKNKSPIKGSKRYNDVKTNTYDTKFGYHILRLIDECEQILVEGDLDLQRNREQLKSVRNGEWSQDRIIKYFETKELHLEEAYLKSKLPHSPDSDKIKKILMECLEMHFGNISDMTRSEKNSDMLINDIENILKLYK